MSKTKYLDTIKTPHQLRRLNNSELSALAEELRDRIVEVVSANGGHLASNLGVAELTIAMHYVFDFSTDHLLWDVGHQCYAHKLLTGRADDFDKIRQADGPSGFPSPKESDYDRFSTGHAGTAISTAMGLAWADKVAKRNTKTVAVVGDASIVNGLSFEGLNNMSLLKRQFLVVLNDNSMAIDRTPGALANALDHLRTSHTYGDIKHSAENLLRHLPLAGDRISEILKHVREGLRTTIHGPQIFETLGMNYFGPIDGHDIPALIRVLKRIKSMPNPVVLHVHTQKGRGCAYAVDDPCQFHSPSAYTIEDGKAVYDKTARISWTKAFAKSLIALAEQDEKIYALTAAMPDGTGLAEFREVLPKRIIDVGICESHAVAMAAGMAKAGLKPVVAVYSTFMQRAFDQVFEEASLQKLPVVLCMDRAGLVGSDGAVHHGFSDIALLRTLPGMVLMAPADEAEMDAALKFATADGDNKNYPTAIRYPRDEVPTPLPGDCPPFELGKSRVVREGKDATLLAYGAMTEHALTAADKLKTDHGLDVAVINARFAKPLDATEISKRISAGTPMLVIEDHAKTGGIGSAILELACERGIDASNVRLCGIPDRYISHASRPAQLREVGLDADSLVQITLDMLPAKNKVPAGKK
ncbi:MAG: 1-deoxy-D-xylulose-5-phosphate synthase [Phycisphaerae bacterium]|nr:1-deoxy-D-xylulose-5-phosphate synthase [Phycisphaerae bacterium]